MIPLLLVFALVPLIMRAYVYDPGLDSFNWFPDKMVELDLFLYWKGIVLVVLALIMIIALIIRLCRNTKEIKNYKREYWIYFLIGYSILILISTLLSPYRNYGLSGIYKQFESVWVVLSYCIITLYAFYVIRSENDLKKIRIAFGFLLIVLCSIGLSQLAGKDLFESELGMKLLFPESLSEIKEQLSFYFSGSGTHQVYMTLYNPNYVGVFAALVLPLTVIWIFTAQSIRNKAGWALLALLLLVCTFGSGSKTFILSLGAVLLIALIFYRKIILKYWKWTIGIVVLVAICGTGYFAYRDVNVFHYVKDALIVEKSEHALEHVETTENSISITYRGDILNIQYIESDGGIYYIFTDENGNYLQQAFTAEGEIAIDDDRFRDYRFAAYIDTEEYAYLVTAFINDIPLSFAKIDGRYQFVNVFGKVDDIVPIETAIFTEYDHFATNRGYIWSRTIPLLKEYWLLGSGADTFTIAFPQNDYIGKFNVAYHNTLITKPHNLYLQIAVQYGGLALLCFLSVCLIYLWQCGKLYWRADLTHSRHMFGIGIMLGIIGYLVSGITNDSCVAVAPVFWGLLGVGFAVNRMNKNETALK